MNRQLPGEWTPQAATVLVWPRDDADWGRGLTAARDAIGLMAASLAPFQPVVIVAADDECMRDLRNRQQDSRVPGERVSIVIVPADDIWARDTGPITVIEAGRRIFVDFRFDGWGGQFGAGRDDALTGALFNAGALGGGDHEHRDITLEGGSIESNGAGSIMTTERCLLGGRRNADMDRPRAEGMLADTLGAAHVLWLTNGDLIGDDTDGHIDTLARFVAADTIVFQGCDDEADDHHAALAGMKSELAGFVQPDGQPYRLIELPLPAPQHDADDGHRLPAGYANFLIANGCVLMPAFDDPADPRAAAIIGRCFPGRRIIPIDSRALIRQHGGLHCAAMQIPALPAD